METKSENVVDGQMKVYKLKVEKGNADRDCGPTCKPH